MTKPTKGSGKKSQENEETGKRFRQGYDLEYGELGPGA